MAGAPHRYTEVVACVKDHHSLVGETRKQTLQWVNTGAWGRPLGNNNRADVHLSGESTGGVRRAWDQNKSGSLSKSSRLDLVVNLEVVGGRQRPGRYQIVE